MQNTQAINVSAGNATATGSVTVSDNMPAVPCPDPAGYKYVGARYVPLFADPAEWNINNTYEPLTIVINEGNSYTSKQFVPVGIQIDNEEYWALTGNYNAQVELYRKQVIDLSEKTAAIQETADTLVKQMAVEQDSGLKGYIDGDVILIGDSFTDGTSSWNATWVDRMANAAPNVKFYNYADRGAGFVKEGNRLHLDFIGQANKAVAEIANKGDVKHIIVFGGINDCRWKVSTTTVQNNCTTVMNTLSSNFKNAVIHVIAVNAGITDLINEGYKNLVLYQRAVKNGVKQSTCNYTYDDCAWWLFSTRNGYSSDYLHPSATTGNLILYQNVMKVLTGRGEWYSEYATVSTNNVQNIWTTKLANALNGFKVENGEVIVPSFFIQIEPTEYVKINKGIIGTGDMTTAVPNLPGYNALCSGIGMWSTNTECYWFRYSIQTNGLLLLTMVDGTNSSTPESIDSTINVFFAGIKSKIGITAITTGNA